MPERESAPLLELLSATDWVGPERARRLLEVWRAEAGPGESLAAYLGRRGYLAGDGALLLEWFARGRVVLRDAGQLLSPAGTDFLRRLPAGAAPRQPATMYADSSLDPPTLRVAGPVASEAAAARVPQVGTLLGRCLLTSQLGRGGNCTVFRALHQGLNISVAVKVLNEQITRQERAYRQLRDEARLLAQLDHPNVLRVLDFEDDPASPYVVMECVEGLSLAELLQQSGALEARRAVHLVCQVAEALAAIWGLGIVHRDVKPGNILLTRDGSVKLADLGLALQTDPSSGAADAGGLVGTAAYMAPEQVNRGVLDFRADMYALGATFYQMVTGRLLFDAPTIAGMMVKHLSEQPRPPAEFAPHLPAGVSAVIARLLAKSPDDRYSDAAELLADLDALREAEGGGPPTLAFSGGSTHGSARVGRRTGPVGGSRDRTGPRPTGGP